MGNKKRNHEGLWRYTISEHYLNEINANEKFVGMLKLQTLSPEEKAMIPQYLMLVLELSLLKQYFINDELSVGVSPSPGRYHTGDFGKCLTVRIITTFQMKFFLKNYRRSFINYKILQNSPSKLHLQLLK